MTAALRPNDSTETVDGEAEKVLEEDPLVFRSALALAFLATGIATIVIAFTTLH